ncbi:MAG: chitobiase/beta-hexosaminidase C-terminal domain-containing protein, partial [Clostridiales bacterium]|nr:chitobiase/beta-hexosaminidase C-terminal domain-containing protein [Clostridiales bacterium]
MKRKRVLSGLGALAFACLSAGVLAATGRKPPPTVSAAAPNTTREFTIAGFVEYYPFTETSHAEQTRGLAASGLNWIDLPLTYSNPGTTTANLNADTFDWDAFNTLSGELGVYFSMTTNNNSYSGAEIAKAVARAGDLDRCIAYYVKDEPSSAQIPAVADAFKQYRQADPGRFPYVNLFPNYAGASNLGGSYEDYARQWVAAAGADNLEYLYFDHYPFTQNAGSVRASYFSDVETIRKVAYENGKLKTGGYTQMGTWNGMREPTPDEARWSMNSLLAYGMKSISHFCWVAPAYVQPPAGEGMGNHVLTSTGAETARYAPMQRLNWQTRQLGPVLMSIDTAHAYHTGSAPSGTEALPKNFLLQPANAGDNLIFSLCYGKDGGLYLMLFSKELSGSKSYTVNADTSTGMTGLTWYKPDSFDVLPTPSAGLELPAPQEVPVPFSDGSFTVELQAGEMRLYRIEGGAEIKEDLKAPTISHKSGAYVGRQSVTMSAPDAGTEIYYTTDGSYPTYRSARYTAPISIGADGQTSFHTVRAIAIRGAEITEPAVSELIIADASVNAAQGKAAYFQTANGVPIGTETFNGSGTAGSVTDGAFDPFNAYGSADGKPGFA